MLVMLIGILVTITVMRGRRARRPPQDTRPAADPHRPARLAELRRGDPQFDEQLLREAAQMACLVMFATMSDGDERLIRHLAAPSFWPTYFGRYLKVTARDAR